MTKIEHQNRIHFVKHLYLYICLTIITFATLLIGYWLIFPLSVITFNGPAILDKQIFYKGEQIVYHLSYCKKKDVVGTVYRTLVNDTITSFSPITSNLPAGCRSVTKTDLKIPDNSEEGTYHLEAIIQYKVNPIKTISNSWRSNDFKIIK